MRFETESLSNTELNTVEKQWARLPSEASPGLRLPYLFRDLGLPCGFRPACHLRHPFL